MKRLQRWISGVLLCALLAAAMAAPASAASASFRDVPAGHWAEDYIHRAVQLGLVDEEADFGLGQPMTRAAFTVMLCRLFGWEMQTPDKGSFADNQDPSAWYYSAVETACAHGAVTRQSSLFRPEDPLTREEMVVALVRALGYTTIAGLDQGLPCPFEDVESNKGYLTMAYYLGVSGGTSDTTFSPEQTATREQAVVMLVRIHDLLAAAVPERTGVISAAAELEGLSGCTSVAVSGGRLTSSGAVVAPAADEEARLLRENIRAAGAEALLKVTGSQAALGADTTKTAQAIALIAEEYDGVLLDIPDVSASMGVRYTNLVTAIRKALGGKKLFVIVEAPASSGAAYGYRYAALSACADRLILRTAPYDRELNGFPAAPQEPLEEVYYALSVLKGQVDLSRCSLWLSTTGLYRTEKSTAGTMPAEQIHDLMQDQATNSYYSARYADAYLSGTVGKKHTVVWYHDGRAMAARTQLCAFFGVGGVCLSDLSSVADYEDYSILSGLEA